MLASDLLLEEKNVKKEVKDDRAALHLKTKETIENLTDDEVRDLLEQKWITPIVRGINELPNGIISKLVNEIASLTDKYAVTYSEIVEELSETKSNLSSFIDGLSGSEYDMKGLSEFQSLIKGE